MNIKLFNKPYWLRRFGTPVEVKGYLSETKEDIVVELNVHPLGTDQLQALPEGERTVKRLEAQSSVPLVATNENAEVKGDLLLYHGHWYECVSSQAWDHTLLSHWNCQFVLVPTNGPRAADIQNPPSAEPTTARGGGV